MPKKDRKSGTSMIEESPLLSKDLASSLHSTINPDRLDPARFSELRVEEESPLRIILYVLVVIVIGVGAAFLVRQLISEDDTKEPETNQENNTDNDVEEQVLLINTAPRAESLAQNKPATDAFITASLVTLGNPNVNTALLKLNKVLYDNYTTFARMQLEMDGIAKTAAINEFPQISVEFDDVGQQIEVKLGTLSVHEKIAEGFLVGGIVREVRYDQVENVLIIFLVEDTRYTVRIEGNALVLELKTERQYKIESELPDDTDESDEEVPVDTTDPVTQPEEPTDQPPSGINYKNDFSQNTQYIVSTVNTNSIDYNEMFYEDYGPSFEIAWGSRNNVGDQYIPNAKAEMIEEGGKFFIEVTIENLATYRDLGKADASNISVNLAAANFISGKLVSFEDGVVIYRVEIKRKADFRLVTEPTVSGQTQVLALQIND